MRFLPILLAAFAAASLSSSAVEENFLKAQAAYDDARYAEAVMLYDKLLGTGVANTEVHYNIANAYFKDGDLSKAVWHYRKAWYNAPRDPDIRANLHFALNAAGAVEPAPGFAERLFSSLSRAEWIAAAIGGYVLLSALLLLALLIRPARRMLLKTSMAPVAIILLSAGGWWQWNQLVANPEWVVVKTEATALYGPVEGSTAHYKLPPGALARQSGTDPKGWVEVEYDGRRGWLKSEYISPVSP